MNTAVAIPAPTAQTSVLIRMAERFGVDKEKMLITLRATAFKGDVSVEQLMMLLVVCEQYSLNPWTREIFAFSDKRAGIIPVVSVDGWSRIINSNPNFDGLEFVDGPDTDDGMPSWIECVIYRKDRSHAVRVREYFKETYRAPVEKEGKKIDGPWQSHPRRMLRHKSLIQCSRIAFGFAGIYDQDEAERIIDVTPKEPHEPRPDTSAIDPVEIDKWVGTIIDVLAFDKQEGEIASELRDINIELSKFPELYTAVFDALKARGIITKAKFKEYLKL